MLDGASRKFAKAYVPADQEAKKAAKRDEVRKEAERVAAKKTWVWANNHAAKLAKTYHEKAEKACVHARRFFNDAEETVHSHLDEIQHETKVQVSKAQIEATKWANSTKSNLQRDR